MLAIGLDNKRKFHLVGLSMGGFVAGVFAAQYPSLLSSLVLMCPAGINAPKLSDFLREIASGGKNYLLPLFVGIRERSIGLMSGLICC